MKRLTAYFMLLMAPLAAHAMQQPIELHHQIATQGDHPRALALTLDACAGKFDRRLIDFLISHRIPATIFATAKWLRENPTGVAVIRSNLSLFDVEDHGADHVPAVIGRDRRVYGLRGAPDLPHLRREVTEGARAIDLALGVAPHWYRGATAEYDPQAIREIKRLGFKIAGFSVNADSGATLNQSAIEHRLKGVRPGDVIIAHMNKPKSDTARGLAVALTRLQRQGFEFVRLDEVELKAVNKRALRLD